MEKITLAELKERQQFSSLDEYTDMDLSHEEDYNRFKDIFPKSVEAIEKLPIDKIYVNTEDLQGDDFAFYRYGSLRAWAYQALEWAFTDDYDEEAEPDDWKTVNVYRLFAGFKEEIVIDTINEYWQIELAELEVNMNKEMQTKQLSQWLKDSVNCLIDHQEGCGTYKLDDHLAVCVGWSGGYSNEPDESVIQATDDLTYAIDAAIKVWTSDSMRTDLDYINAPYYENGDVIDIGISISKNEDYDKLAEYFLKEYEGLKDLEIKDDGLIISSKPLKTFYISVTETLKKTVEVRAEDKYEAIQKVSDAYHDGQVVLDSDDYVEVDFSDETEETINNYELGGMPKFYEVQ